MPSAELLRASALTVRYGRVAAVDAVSMSVSTGEVVGLVGPNGSGKTSTLRAVVGMTRPTSGWVRLHGHLAGSAGARAAAAFVPDSPRGFDELTVAEYLDLVRALYGEPAGFRERADLLLAAFGLTRRRVSALRTLSTGMRRQVSIVAAAATQPPLLVVDEATATLDPEAVVVLREVVRGLAASGRGGVLLATQDLAFAESVCSRLYLLHRGAVVTSGSMTDFGALAGRLGATDGSLESVFLAAAGLNSGRREVHDAFALV